MNDSGEPLLSPIDLPALLLPPKPGAPLWPGAVVTLVSHARYALDLALQQVRAGRVLAPALICDTAVDDLPGQGREVRFYPVAKDFSPDWAWLENHPHSSDAALLLVHYFGFPNDVERAVAFARERGLVLIEDCAHSFLSTLRGQPLGSFGDFSVLSFRKTLPLRSGGALISRKPLGAVVRHARLPDTAAGFLVREIVKWALFRTGSAALARRFGSAVSDEAAIAFEACGEVDGLSRRLLGLETARFGAIRDVRRRNYAQLARGLAEARFEAFRLPFPVLDDGVCPWALPLESPHADDLVHTLLSEGIGAWKWPDLPGTLPQGLFQRERELANRTVLLPVHQNLGPAHIRYMIDTVTAWSLSVP